MIDYPLEEVEQEMSGRRIKTMRKPRDLKSKRMQSSTEGQGVVDWGVESFKG